MNSKKDELYLLHSEILIILRAEQFIKEFKIKYSVPPVYGNQTPLFIKIREESLKKIMKYEIVEDINPPNKLIVFSIKTMEKNEEMTLHFDFLVIIKNKKYQDLPKNVEIACKSDLPENTKIWLESTEAVQSENILIRIKAKFLRGLSNNFLVVLKRIIFYTPFHRILLQQVRMFLEKNSFFRSFFLPRKYWTGLCDAISYFIFGGHCAGQANFATSLLRAIGIPTKILIVREFGLHLYKEEKEWFDSQHYLIESYCPDYGWITCTPGQVGRQPKNYIITRVVYPDDENIAGNGLSYYGGMEPWFWIDNSSISLVFPEKYINFCKKPIGKVSGVPIDRLMTEKKLFVNQVISKKIFYLAFISWNLFTINVEKHLKENNNYFKKALEMHQDAVDCFINADIKKFISKLNNAIKIYKKIKPN